MRRRTRRPGGDLIANDIIAPLVPTLRCEVLVDDSYDNDDEAKDPEQVFTAARLVDDDGDRGGELIQREQPERYGEMREQAIARSFPRRSQSRLRGFEAPEDTLCNS
jgi:hypothetical protein